MRVDRPDPAGEPGDDCMAGSARRFDEPGASGRDLEQEARSAGRSGSPPALPDAAFRIGQTLGYRARVEVVFQQHNMDRDHSTAKEPEREVAFVGRRAEADDWHPRLQSARYEALDRPSCATSYRVTVDAVYDAHQSEAAESSVRKTLTGDFYSWDKVVGGQGNSSTDGLEGKLFHADADPLRVFGPASETHPEEFQGVMVRLGEAGVEVDLRPGSMSYSPAAGGGQPGRLILDPDASYGAVLHEMSHFSDDESADFPGLRYWLEDSTVTVGGESRAYQTEIDYANSIGEPGIADQLEQLKAQRIRQLIGENYE